jgi:hypothetical protein
MLFPADIKKERTTDQSMGDEQFNVLICAKANPMAEPTGLFIGTIALASLFSTCLELAEYFELGRSFVYDYRLACLKLALLKSRLGVWGDSLGVRDAGHEREELRMRWGEEQEVIGCSLLGIKEIFGNAEALADKYRLLPRESRSLDPSFLVPSKIKAICGNSSIPAQSSKKSRFFTLRRTTTWAIRDKQKFDGLLLDLDFFIGSLEQVIARIDMPNDEQQGAKPLVTDLAKPNSHKSRNSSLNRPQIFHNDTTQRTQANSQLNGEGPAMSATIGRHDFQIERVEDQAKTIVGVFDGGTAPENSKAMTVKIQCAKGNAQTAVGIHTISSMTAFFSNPK